MTQSTAQQYETWSSGCSDGNLRPTLLARALGVPLPMARLGAVAWLITAGALLPLTRTPQPTAAHWRLRSISSFGR